MNSEGQWTPEGHAIDHTHGSASSGANGVNPNGTPLSLECKFLFENERRTLLVGKGGWLLEREEHRAVAGGPRMVEGVGNGAWLLEKEEHRTVHL